MKSEGYAPNDFPFQAFVHKLYMVITAKKKSKTGSQILPKIIHIYPKKLRKREAIVQALSPKYIVFYLFIP